MAASVETKNLMKFERQFVSLVSKKKGRNGRYNQSIDFVGANMDLQKFANEARQADHQGSVDLGKEVRLPTIGRNASTKSGIFDFLKSASTFEINAEAGKPLMSMRERKFQINRAIIKDQLQETTQKGARNQYLSSNHYRFNRVKQGGWGG